MRRALIFVVLVLSLLCFIPSSPTEAGMITVGGSCTLVDAIRAANSDASVGGCPAGSSIYDSMPQSASQQANPIIEAALKMTYSQVLGHDDISYHLTLRSESNRLQRL